MIRSAEVDQEEITDSTLLAQESFFFLRVKLHIEGVKNIKMNNRPFSKHISKLYPDNDLLHLGIKNNTVFLEIGWRQSNPPISDFSAFEIEAKKIWWENIPDLSDDYCRSS